jgi:hypothetical protein
MNWKVTLKETSEMPQKIFAAEKHKYNSLSGEADDFSFRINRVLIWMDYL